MKVEKDSTGYLLLCVYPRCLPLQGIDGLIHVEEIRYHAHDEEVRQVGKAEHLSADEHGRQSGYGSGVGAGLCRSLRHRHEHAAGTDGKQQGHLFSLVVGGQHQDSECELQCEVPRDNARAARGKAGGYQIGTQAAAATLAQQQEQHAEAGIHDGDTFDGVSQLSCGDALAPRQAPGKKDTRDAKRYAQKQQLS